MRIRCSNLLLNLLLEQLLLVRVISKNLNEAKINLGVRKLSNKLLFVAMAQT
jgi:hypothetical protein